MGKARPRHCQRVEINACKAGFQKSGSRSSQLLDVAQCLNVKILSVEELACFFFHMVELGGAGGKGDEVALLARSVWSLAAGKEGWAVGGSRGPSRLVEGRP